MQVRAVSARLLQLQSLFGEDSGVDVAAMLIREPQLAAADMKVIARRLLEMRVCHQPFFQTVSPLTSPIASQCTCMVCAAMRSSAVMKAAGHR